MGMEVSGRSGLRGYATSTGFVGADQVDWKALSVEEILVLVLQQSAIRYNVTD
jgi:hypothetical protein